MKPIIIGAGIGGLAASIAMRRAGIEPVLYEQAGDLSKMQVGAGLGIWHNAMRVLQRLGLGDQILAIAPTVSTFEGWSWKGEKLAVWPVKEMGERLGAPTVGMSRQDLYAVLLDAVPRDSIHTSARCVGFEQDADTVTARFADGSTAQADVLIGADGLNSSIRAQLLGRDPPRYAGYTVWRAQVDYQADDVPTGAFLTIWGRGQRFIFYFVRPGRIYWLAVRNAEPGGQDDPARIKDELVTAYRGWMAPVEAIIAATPSEAIHRTDIQDRAPVDRWGQGRVTLLGDAAHPMTFNVGQGAGQAIEDGFVLTNCLREEPVPERALRRYESKRMKRTAAMTNLAWRMGLLGRWKNPIACSFRNRLMKAMNSKAMRAHEHDMAVEL